MTAWTVGKRIAASFAVVTLLLLFVAGFSFLNTGRLVVLAGLSKSAMESNAFVAEKLADHLSWMIGLDLYLLGVRDFTGATDHRKCRFGQWFYSKETQEGIGDAEVRDLLKQIETPHMRLHQSAATIKGLKKGGDAAGARRLYESVSLPSSQATIGLLGRLRQHYDALSRATADELARTAASARTMVAATGAAALGAAIILALVFRRHITRILWEAIRQLQEMARQLTSAASQISSSGQSLASAATRQAASLEETSAAAEHVSSMARENFDGSRQAAEMAAQSQQRFAVANQVLEQLVVAVGEMNASSDKISKIIKVIDGIAFQTNILALNAAVEAARAGEAGMGFAVVAEEVRNLAQRCAQAARETASLIEESIAKSNDGKARVAQASQEFHAITEQLAKTRTLVDGVNSGSHEQARGIEQIAKAVAQMDQVTQKTAASAEESAAAAEQLSAQSEAVGSVVTRLAALIENRSA